MMRQQKRRRKALAVFTLLTLHGHDFHIGVIKIWTFGGVDHTHANGGGQRKRIHGQAGNLAQKVINLGGNGHDMFSWGCGYFNTFVFLRLNKQQTRRGAGFVAAAGL